MSGILHVEFPDLPGCQTEADTLEDAYNMAGDALFVWFDDETQDYPEPSRMSDLKTDGEDFVTLVKAEPYESEAAIKYRASRWKTDWQQNT